MNTSSRKSLASVLPHIHTDFQWEQNDDFINYKYEGHTLRVVRFVGPGRSILVFNYPKLPTYKRDTTYRRCQTIFFFSTDGTLVSFDHKAVEAEWKAQHPGKTLNWEQAISTYIVAHGAQEFRGVNWVGHIASALVHITHGWLQAHNLSLP